MNIKVNRSNIGGEITLVGSKSLLHRYLIMASKSEKTIIEGVSYSQDIIATINCLERLGVIIDRKKDSLLIKKGQINKRVELDVIESGASLRFLLAFSFLHEREVTIKASGRLSQRPLTPLIDELKRQGVEFESDHLPIKACGRINSNEFQIDGNVSSQFVSSFMLASGLMDKKSLIKINNGLRSIDYVLMTKQVLEEFHVSVSINEDFSLIEIDPSQYKAPEKIQVEGDWSNSIVAISLGLLGGDVLIKGLRENSMQGDRRLINILNRQNANLKFTDDGLMAKPSQLEPFDLDIDENIDLFPVLSVLALASKGDSVFRNIERLRFKESDRIEAVKAMLKNCGALVEVKDNNFYIKYRALKGGIFDSFNDHRLVMAQTVLALILPEGQSLVINNFQAIDKSYPGYMRDMERLGLRFEEVVWKK